MPLRPLPPGPGWYARLNGVLAAGATGSFPVAQLALLDPVADRLAAAAGLGRGGLATGHLCRAGAGAMRRPGPHRWARTGRICRCQTPAPGLAANLASTGQQKALLIGVVLGHAALIADARGAAPLLLLDEPAVHLDAPRRAALWEALLGLSAQVLLTGTDPEPFAALHGHAEGLRTGERRAGAGPGVCTPLALSFRPRSAYIGIWNHPPNEVTRLHVRERCAAARTRSPRGI